MYKLNRVQEADQPIYKLQRNGPESLADEELLALVLRMPQRGKTGALTKTKSFLKQNPLETLANFQIEHPPGQIVSRQIKGADLTKAQLLTLQAAIEFSRRVLNQGMGTEPSITSPLDVLPELRGIKNLKREHFCVVYLNGRNQIQKTETISIGSLNASLVHPREVFQPAIALSAASMILAHNHPSGDCTPSAEDIQLTRRLVKAAEIMGIEILDHLVVSSERFLSMKEANIF